MNAPNSFSEGLKKRAALARMAPGVKPSALPGEWDKDDKLPSPSDIALKPAHGPRRRS